jgi:hypothetical protein
MSEVKEFVVATYMGGRKRNRMPKPVFCWGAPGEGKTFTMYAAARAIGRRLKDTCVVADIPTSCQEPTDVAGVPFPVEINGKATYVQYLGSEWAWHASVEYEKWMQETDSTYVAPPMLLFFDDMVAAHFQTQTAFYKGVHEGKWGSLTQRDNVMVVACGNRVEDNAGANDMPTALGNRFRHCYAKPGTDDWLKWAVEFREDGESGAEGETRIHPLVFGYIRTQKQALREFSAEVASRAEKAFASARTWEDVSEFLWEGEITRDSKIFDKGLMGIVGMGSATMFLGYLRNSTALVPPEEIVKDPVGARLPGRKQLDALHATVASLELHIKQNPKDWKAGVIYAMRDDMVGDVGILLAQTMSEVVTTKLPAKERAKAMGDSVFTELFERYEDLFEIVNLNDTVVH